MQKLKVRSNIVWSGVNKKFIKSVTTLTADEKFDSYKTEKLKPWKEIPGPNSLPVIGPLHNFLPGGIFRRFNGLELSRKLYETYGPIVRLDSVIGRHPQVYVYDAASAEKILRSENWFPVRPGHDSLRYYRKNLRNGPKDEKITGLFTDSGENWKELRSAANPIFLAPKTVKSYSTVIDEIAKDMVIRIQCRRDDENKLSNEFHRELKLWSAESVGMIALGYRMNCLDPNLEENSPSLKLVECVQETFKLVKKLDFSPTIWKLLPTPNYNKAMELYELQENIAKYLISKARQDFNNRKSIEGEKCILEKLLAINEAYALKVVTEILFAGIDTTANSAAAILYLLALNPEKQSKLRKELNSGDEKKLYLKACLKESMRLMPISLGTRRVTTKEYNLMGYQVPPNTTVFLGHQLMCLMEEHYPRPSEFLPERWLAEGNDPLYYKNAHPFAFNPFGFGVRVCIARRLADLMLESFTTRIMESFELEVLGAMPTIEETFINYVKAPHNIVFKDAVN